MPQAYKVEDRRVMLLVSEEERQRYKECFACGPQNSQGLKLDFRVSADEGVWSLFQPRSHHQGWPHALHGGLVATLLDEAAAYVAVTHGSRAVTARLNLRFQNPAPLDAALRVEARLVRSTGRLLEVHGTVTTSSGGETIAEADATLVVLTDVQKRAFGLMDAQTKEGK